ncbi:zf-HC2 domain-containing protein [Litchfieldella rifensis]|uniref:Zf-HC2 domain-containing protein n=1 Tax=Litchfieldella rifensis TaxID=762643 RepID=A0ABV7LQX8_9GAMM
MFKMMMCKEATRLMSKRLDTPLSFQEKLSLKLHLAMCDACQECNRQFTLLHEVGPKFEELVIDTSSDSRNSPKE